MSDVPTTRLFLFRHGQVAGPWRGRIYGDLNVPLSPRGEEESRQSALRLAGCELDAVVSSGLDRAEFLAGLLREGRGLERRDDPRLREIHRGEWRGQRPAELPTEDGRNPWDAWHDDVAERRPPGGESVGDLAARVLPALGELTAEFAGGQVAVVAHSWVLRSYVCHALGLPLRQVNRMVLPTAALVVVDAAADADVRPTLSAFVVDRAPFARSGWFRGPHRGR